MRIVTVAIGRHTTQSQKYTISSICHHNDLGKSPIYTTCTKQNYGLDFLCVNTDKSVEN